MPTRVEEYMEAFMAGVASEDDAPEEVAALDKMEAIWATLSEQEQDEIRDILGAKVRERLEGLQEQVDRHEAAKVPRGQA